MKTVYTNALACRARHDPPMDWQRRPQVPDHNPRERQMELWELTRKDKQVMEQRRHPRSVAEQVGYIFDGAIRNPNLISV